MGGQRTNNLYETWNSALVHKVKAKERFFELIEAIKDDERSDVQRKEAMREPVRVKERDRIFNARAENLCNLISRDQINTDRNTTCYIGT
ncbi:hypothetical protein Ciccas_001303 [Cichlidogyrus casuarinus]|uniref:Uncharacterized protein n=1 Tax=Cichlidogyrus casuarinus TaxID=1844966 RepID=A0ABD2QKE9_9PLAT